MGVLCPEKVRYDWALFYSTDHMRCSVDTFEKKSVHESLCPASIFKGLKVCTNPGNVEQTCSLQLSDSVYYWNTGSVRLFTEPLSGKSYNSCINNSWQPCTEWQTDTMQFLVWQVHITFADNYGTQVYYLYCLKKLMKEKPGTTQPLMEISDTGHRTKDKATTSFPGSDVGLETSRVR